MITSILNAYPEGDFFDTVMRDLQGIADSAPVKDGGASVQLPQVHAFNCLKDIFTESKFGDSVEPHMSIFLEIAVRGLESDQYEICLKKPKIQAYFNQVGDPKLRLDAFESFDQPPERWHKHTFK